MSHRNASNIKTIRILRTVMNSEIFGQGAEVSNSQFYCEPEQRGYRCSGPAENPNL